MTLLSGEHGYRYITQIRSALKLGLRPSAHILKLKNPASHWSDMDHVVAEAYQRLEDETCPQCGQPIWICRSGNSKIMFPVRTDICQVEGALEKHRESPSNKKKKKVPGEFEYVVPQMRDDSPLPTREAYYMELEEERKIHGKR